MAKKTQPFKKNKYEIIWHIINSLLSAVLVLAGAFSTGHIDKESFIIAGMAALAVFVLKFKEYWDGEEGEYSYKLFKFI